MSDRLSSASFHTRLSDALSEHTASLASTAAAESDVDSRWEKGKDLTQDEVTKGMSPEEKAKWISNTEKHKDKFKNKSADDDEKEEDSDEKEEDSDEKEEDSDEKEEDSDEKEEDSDEKEEDSDEKEEDSDDDDDDEKEAKKKAARLAAMLPSERQRLTWGKEAAPGGLYGFTKKTQTDCEAAMRRIQKEAGRLAASGHKRNPRVAAFLTTHAKRTSSQSAKILLAAMKVLGPRVAADKTAAGSGAANAKYLDSLSSGKKGKILKHVADHYGVSVSAIESELTDRDAENLYEYTATDRAMTMEIYRDFKRLRLGSDKEAAGPEYGLYGFKRKTATLGLSMCSEIRDLSGRVAYNLHARRVARHERITAFFQTHGKKARSPEARILLSSYPDAMTPVRTASAPASVDDWLAWDES
jgi:hypothetical protein